MVIVDDGAGDESVGSQDWGALVKTKRHGLGRMPTMAALAFAD